MQSSTRYLWRFVITIMIAHTTAGSSSGDTWNHSLFRAIRRGDLDLVGSMLRQGTPPNLSTSDGTTALMIAARDGSAAGVRLLLEHGADANAVNRKGVTALLWGAGDPQKVRLLLEHGADVNARSALGNTPLYVAAAHPGMSATVRLLLRNGAESSWRDRNSSPLSIAVFGGDARTVELLLEAGSDQGKVNHFDAGGISLLELAARQGHAEVCEALINHGARFQERDSDFAGKALNNALLAQKPTLAMRFIERGASLTRLTNAGKVPPIMLAAYTEAGDTSVANAMIQRGVDLSKRNQYDESVLTWARRRGHPELIEMLVKAGAEESDDPTPEIPERSVNLHAGNQQELLSSAIHKSLRLLQQSSDVFLRERRSCVSCHHQNLPSVAIGWARDRGFEIDDDSTQRMVDRQVRGWKRFIDRAYQMDRPVPVPPRFLGYGLWGFHALGYEPDEVTEASVWYLAALQHADGHWTAGMLRPPLGGADILATTVAMRSLQLYPLAGRQQEFEQRVQRAANWLAQADPRYHQERVFQLLGRAWAGADTEELGESIEQLLADQNDDGGWAQLPNLSSDAWATAQSLVALRLAGGLRTNHQAYRRGLEFLLRTQFDDGSWYVKARAWPFQTPFNSGFPFERDQWVSAPATAWSVMAMLLAMEPRSDVMIVADRPKRSEASDASKDVVPGEGSGVPAQVDFATDIKPLLDRSCVACHSGKEPQGGYRLTSREEMLRGGESGEAAVVAGDADASLLLQLVASKIEELDMPPLSKRDKFPALSDYEIAKLRAWITAGAP